MRNTLTDLNNYEKAGFRFVGKTKKGLLAFQLLPEDMPPPSPALPPL